MEDRKYKDLLLSKTIDNLRFPLIIGVLFIHSHSSIMITSEEVINGASNISVYNFFSTLFSQIIGRVSVPLFFFISGYLFFFHPQCFGVRVYRTKLKSRLNSLLIPYLFWNILFLFIYYIISCLPTLRQWFDGTEYNLNYILSNLWGRSTTTDEMTYPGVYQFWFIRDLMSVSVLSPLIYWIVTKTQLFGVLLIGLAWYLGYSIPYIGVRGLSTVSVFYFLFGAWFSINRKNLLVEFGKLRSIPFFCYPLLVMIDLYTKNNDCNIYIHKIGIIIGIVFWFGIISHLLERRKVKIYPFLSSASFFVFAIHEPWLLSQVKKILFTSLHPENDFLLTFLYFFIVGIVLIISLSLYYLLKSISPRFLAFIAGGR